jgi:tetratricopeptide (TPR) repeat protein
LFPPCCREIEEQLADALYKRSQAKLMADPDQANVESALADALKALTLYAEDDDYYMVVSTCYMRLNRYEEARKMLETVLERSPKNYKALYHHAFCQRASGSQRDAIEGLTKVGVSHTRL